MSRTSVSSPYRGKLTSLSSKEEEKKKQKPTRRSEKDGRR
jgi:hypothetical protein